MCITICFALQDPGTARYGPEMVYAKGTAGLYEIEPSMRWNPAVVAGVGMIQDPRPLYDDMHSYLAQSGRPHWLADRAMGHTT